MFLYLYFSLYLIGAAQTFKWVIGRVMLLALIYLLHEIVLN